MFYSQFILAKKGPLGTIWIAAHLERKLRKNQVADTDIGVSVDSILFPDMPIALRLSSHLLLGVVRIYSRKVNYLFDDCSDALLKIKQAFRSTAVDLPPEESTAPYHSITLPETFDLDDFEIPNTDMFQGNYVDHHVSTKEQITLQDSMNGVVYSSSKFGLDERFGDGDTSQEALEFEEDIFLTKTTLPSEDAAEPNMLASNVDAGFYESAIPLPNPRFDVDDYAQAPSTPGLIKEPNIPTIQEGLACDDHFDSEYQNCSPKLDSDHAKPFNHCLETMDIDSTSLPFKKDSPESAEITMKETDSPESNVAKCAENVDDEHVISVQEVEQNKLDTVQENHNGSTLSELPAPEKMLAAPDLVSHTPIDLLLASNQENEAVEFEEASVKTKLSTKRSFMDSVVADQSLNSMASVHRSSSRRPADSIPNDDDLLSSILAGRRSTLRIKPSPEVVERKRARYVSRGSSIKRKVLVDDAMVLLGDIIREQLSNTEDIRRLRKKAPCTRSEIMIIQRQYMEDEIFNESVLEGMTANLQQLQKEKLDLNGVQIVDNECIIVPISEEQVKDLSHESPLEVDQVDEVLPAQTSVNISDTSDVTGLPVVHKTVNDDVSMITSAESDNTTETCVTVSGKEHETDKLCSATDIYSTVSTGDGDNGQFSANLKNEECKTDATSCTLQDSNCVITCSSDQHDVAAQDSQNKRPNDTEFVIVDDDDDDDDDEMMEDDEGGVDGAKLMDDSGWSSRTRAVANYLQTLFEKEEINGRNILSVDSLVAGKSSKQASRMFFETLVLKSKDYIHVEQGEPYESICVKPRAKLMKSDFLFPNVQ